MNKAEMLTQLWEQVMQDSFWSDLTDDELYGLQSYLWANHQDAIMEWTRRQMRKADPKR